MKNKTPIFWLVGVIFFLFSLLAFQFYRLQVIEHKKWEKKAELQHYVVISEPGHRGTFWANTSLRKGHPEKPQKLAVDIRKYHLYIDPKALSCSYKPEIAQMLFSLAKPPPRQANIFFDHFDKNSRSRKVASWLDEETKQAILKWWRPYAKEHQIPSNAVFFAADYLRSHPFGKMLGQILHTVQLQKDEKTLKAYPTGGLELSCDRFVAAKPGKRRLMRSPRHSLEINDEIIAPENGADVWLTINCCLQAIAEEEIEKGVKNAKGKSGWACVMNPHNGHIYAMAQYPYFVVDQYPLYFNNQELMEHAKTRAITDAHEPASNAKAITCAIALLANKEMQKRGKPPLFSPQEKIATSKGNFPGRGKKPLTDTRLHHYLNMYLGLQKSSNIYVAELARRVVENLGDDWYRAQLQNVFGFGKKTGIELGAESEGVLPTPGKKHPNGKLEWSLATPYSLAMGHNFQATSLQVLRAYAILANGGYSVRPTLIRKIVKTNSDNTQEILVDNTTQNLFPQRVLDADIVQEIVKALRYVTKPGGGGVHASVWGYTEAGKSGTSMKLVNGKYSNKSHFANFVGFTPVQNARFVILVGIDEPETGFLPGKGMKHYGGTCAAPVFREIARRSLEYLGAAPDDPHGYPRSDPRFDAEKADAIKEAENLKKLYDEWNR